MQSSDSPRSLAPRTTTACRACHLRKIKCDARSPICSHCLRRGTQCEPHFRTRRAGLSSDDERQLRQRVAWLESELAQAYGLPPEEVRKTRTGESFAPHISESPMECFSLPVAEYTQPLVDPQETPPSPRQGDTEKEGNALHGRPEWRAVLSIDRIYVGTSYIPIFHQRTLDSLVSSVYEDPATLSPAQWTIFYLVMAIGEWNQRHRSDTPGPQGTPTAELFNCAMIWFDRVLPLDGMDGLQIVLLLAINSSYRPTGSSQWHLAGIAIRLCIDMGLHRHNADWKFSPDEWDIRQRVFWVTYAIDRTVCFNLGRPVTLSDDHIDTPFPNAESQSQSPEPSIALALHHIRLRIIQTRIINEVYTLGNSKTQDTAHQRGQILASIQEQLDEWRSQLRQIYSSHQTPHSFKCDILAKGVRLEEVTETCRMCSNILALLSAKWKVSAEFSDTFDSLTNITTKRLVEQLQQRYRGDPLYDSPPGMFSFNQGMGLDSLSWPQDLNFHTALTNPDCITEVFDDLLRAQEGIWNT
ncbi:hypothetical protein N7468_005495 [Penicillium chermesinum]|uniref:Zn(2)-C6 fungal-type domain-containing protein n=1 Tax=Penicillium chermesinum TaxID=63820 RepID=A0A9W9TPR4_9EURO|nr:uncharacterized protein N7468_005495 [Penicillium chermesinum]KAJ5232539.1 hypothetical protein N7468_005495 [Penicillium chermesinum]